MWVSMPIYRRQLLVGRLVSLALVAGISATAIVALRVTTANEGTLAYDLVDDLASVQRLRLQAEEVIAATREYLLTGESQAKTRLDSAPSRLRNAAPRVASAAHGPCRLG